MTHNDAATHSLAGTTIWMVARWLEKHYGGEPYEIFGQKHGYRITAERIPLRPAGEDALEQIKKALVVIDKHFAAADMRIPRSEFRAFLTAYDIPWNNPA